MPEDGIIIDDIGFRFFSQDNGPFIANDRAVQQTFDQLADRIVQEAAFDHLGAAREAVQSAARRKFAEDPRDQPDPQDTEDYVPGDEFFF
jgi:hypothetical protein